MKILTVCQYYYPEPFRIHEVCEELVKRGHEVTVLTGLPNYPMGVIPDEYKDKKHRDEIVNGVHVIRVNEIPRTKGKVGLAKNYVSFVWNASLKALFMRKNFDVIMVYQLSPVLMAIPGFVAKWFSRTRNLVIYCLDLWPESLVSLGISKNSSFFRFIKWVSKRIYKGAYHIGYTSRMFRKYFEETFGMKEEKFSYIPQFADSLFSQNSSEGNMEDADNQILNDNSLVSDGQINTNNHTTINYVFAGNIGEMQSVDTIIRSAKILENEPIKWHIVGDGFALEDCKKLTTELGVEDKVVFYGRRKVEDMPSFYKMADAMIVTLSGNETISYTLPGKIQSYMAAGKAIIAAANGETPIVISDAECGLCAPAEDEKTFANIALEMSKADRKAFGLNSEKYYKEHFSKEKHVDRIEEMLASAVRI